MFMRLMGGFFNFRPKRQPDFEQPRYTRGVIDLASDALLDLPRQAVVYRIDHLLKIVAVTEKSAQGPRVLGVHGAALTHAIAAREELTGEYGFFMVFQEYGNTIVQSEPNAHRLAPHSTTTKTIIDLVTLF